METVLYVIAGLILLGILASAVVTGIIFHKAYKATKNAHKAFARFDSPWESSTTTTRTYSPPARPVARSATYPAPSRSASSRPSSSSSKRSSSGRSSSDDGFFSGAMASSFFSSGSSDSGSSSSSSSCDSSSSSSSSSCD